MFINYVQNFRELWDITSPLYKNKQRKDAAWEEIAEILFEDFREKEEQEKKEIVKKLITKWRNIRDTFSRSEKKRSRSGQPASKIRQYIYARQLSFLQPIIGLAASQSSIEDEGEGYVTSEENSEQLEPPRERDTTPNCTSNPGTPSRSTSKQRRNEIESSIIKFMNQPDELPDEDQAFFDSFLPLLKTFTLDQKLEFRSEVLNVARRIKERGTLRQHPHVNPLQQFMYPSNYYPNPQPFSLASQPQPQPSTSITVSPPPPHNQSHGNF